VSGDEVYAAIERDFESAGTRDAIARLSSDQRSRLRRYWVDRAAGEATTGLTFEFMLDDLTQEGAPAPVLDLARQAIEDEQLHADWCLRWADALDPEEEPARARLSGTAPFCFDRANSHDNRLLRTVFGGCFSETVAVHVLLASHARIRLESVHRLNQQHLREEIGHARVGWALLGWAGVSDSDREMIAAYVPEMIQLTRKVWQSSRPAGEEQLVEMGFLSSSVVDPACDDAIENVVLPGLAKLGVRVEQGSPR